jgi:hypothetical protein
MPPANRDASEITRRRKAMALNAYRQSVNAANTNGTLVRREQAAYGTLDVIVAARQGGCYCAEALSGNYDFNGGGGCGCRN